MLTCARKPTRVSLIYTARNQQLKSGKQKNSSQNVLPALSVRYARRPNPLKCVYFDRLQAAVMLIKGLLSKYARLIILQNSALNKTTCGPDLPKYCLNCTKFGKLVRRKIIKIVASRCRILKLKCTKFDFGWDSAPDPTGGAYIAPQTF